MKNIALAAALLAGAGATLAQETPDINPSWYLQPTIVAIDPDIDFGFDDTGWGGGFRVGKPISRMWDIQFGATHVRVDPGLGDYRQSLLGVDALLMISRKKFRPYLLFGVGAQYDDVDSARGAVDDTSPYLSAGLGFQWSLSQRWALQADIRTVRGFLSSSEQFGTSVSNNKYLTFGLNYALSLPPPPAPPREPEPEPAPTPIVQAPEPAPAPPPPPPRFEKITLSATELFPFDSAQLGPNQPELDKIAAALQADSSITDVTITGYADRIGSERYNLALSKRRAEAVRDYLIAQGVTAGRLTAIGKGEDNPVVTCGKMPLAELKECLRPNRRVEVEDITIERRVQ